MRKSITKKRNFTLIELLVVMVIIGLLAGLAGPSVMAKLKGAKVSTAVQQTKLLRSAVEQYYLDQNKYPSALENLLDKNSYGDTYFSEEFIPIDPWDHDYIYQAPGGSGRDFDITSNGSGSGNGGVISCWDNPRDRKNK